MAKAPGDTPDPFDTPEKAYAEAERRIAEAQTSHAVQLDVQLRWLERLPPSIAGLASLRTLTFDRTRVADLAPLAGLASLQHLTLANTRVADLAPLAGLASLRTLTLARTRVADLAPRAGFASLQHLRLTGTRVADL
ncbi:MAG: leucine-rich repeat domain-containing protein, partial [Hyphomicrobiaceae bacterium]